MANLNGAYDPNAEVATDFSAIPTGDYPAVIVDSDMKPTKKNDGDYLELVHEITEGEYKGRKVWANLNLHNSNATAVEIANRQFASIREATGVANPTDSQQLHYKPVVIRVEFIPSGTTQKNGYVTNKDGNEIKAWKKPAAGASAGNQPASNQAAPATNGAAPPWAAKAA